MSPPINQPATPKSGSFVSSPSSFISSHFNQIFSLHPTEGGDMIYAIKCVQKVTKHTQIWTRSVLCIDRNACSTRNTFSHAMLGPLSGKKICCKERISKRTVSIDLFSAQRPCLGILSPGQGIGALRHWPSLGCTLRRGRIQNCGVEVFGTNTS